MECADILFGPKGGFILTESRFKHLEFQHLQKYLKNQSYQAIMIPFYRNQDAK
jgi:hypothetical protein